MSEKVTFEKDGTYHRGGRVEEMDVQRTPGSIDAPAKAEKKTVPQPTNMKKSAPSPGTFDLSALRKSVNKASTTVARTTLPEQNAVEFSHVVEVQRVPEAKKPEVVSASDVNMNSIEAAAGSSNAPTSKDESAAPVTPVSAAEAFSAPAQEVVPAEEAPKAETEKVVETATSTPKPFDLNSLKSQAMRAEAVKPKVEPEKVVETPITPAEEVSEMELEQDSQPVPEKLSAEFDGNGFRLIALKEFISALHLDEFQLARWCRTCAGKTVEMPATVFTASFNSDVRFYNFFNGRSPQWMGAVIGCGDNIACVQVQVKSLVLQDNASVVSIVDGSVVVNGDTLALYSERFRETRKV